MVAQGYVDVFIPMPNITQAPNDEIGIENCYAIDPTDGDGEPSTGAGQFNPKDLTGATGIPEDLSDNCTRHSIIALPISPSIEFRKQYRPCTGTYGCFGKTITDDMEFYSEFSILNDTEGNYLLQDIKYCDMFDNRTQFLRAPAFPTENDASVPVSFEYGVGDWGLQSGILYDQQAAWDSSWYKQSTATCEDDAPIDYQNSGKRWFTEADIDWTNSNLAGKINANEINFVRIQSTDLPTDEKIMGQIPLQARDNNSGDYLTNYANGTWSTGAYLDNTCNGADLTSQTCPMPPQLIYRWGQYYYAKNLGLAKMLSDSYVHMEKPINITKSLDPIIHPYPGRFVERGKPANWVLGIITRPDPNFPTFPPNTQFAEDVIVKDILVDELTYIPGSSQLDGVPIPDPIIQYNPQAELTWSLGDLPIQTDPALLTFQTNLSSLVGAGERIYNSASVDSLDDNREIICDPYRWVKCARNILNTLSSGSASVEKLSSTPAFTPGDELIFSLNFARLNDTPIDWVDFVDILPYNGDSRGTSFKGSIQIASVTDSAGLYPGPSDPFTVWASAIPPQTLDIRGGSQPNDDNLSPVNAYGGEGQGLGGADWPCQLSQVIANTCTEIRDPSKITAIRIYGPKPANGSFIDVKEGPYGIDLHFFTDQSAPHDYYGNSFGGNFHGMLLSTFASSYAQVQTFAVGDRVFFDENDDGVFTEGIDTPLPNIKLNLLDKTGNPLLRDGLPISTNSDANGRFLFIEVMNNEVILEIDAKNFSPYQPLECLIPIEGSTADSSSIVDDENEEQDHNASNTMPSGAVRSGIVQLAIGTEPLNDDRSGGTLVPAEYSDGSTNLTVDFGFYTQEGCTPKSKVFPPPTMPDTGFAPQQITNLPTQPAEKTYSDLGSIWLEIPSLGITESIVGVPLSNQQGWDTSWLGNTVGYLEGSAFPATHGNTILSAHNYLPSGSPGLFLNIENLSYGDKIILHAWGTEYQYVVRLNKIVNPAAMGYLKDSAYDELTLITCKDYSPWADSYRKRVLVKAVLQSVKIE